MMIRAELKERAKAVFAEQRSSLVLGFVILAGASMLLSSLSSFSSILSGLSQGGSGALLGGFTSPDVGVVSSATGGAMLGAALGSSLLINALVTVLSLGINVLGAGYSRLCLRATDGETVALQEVFACFKDFARWLLFFVLVSIKTLLWSLLFIIPGIIAALNYSQAIYLMLDDPELRPSDAIKKSIELMRGHRAEYFVLELSFVLWGLLVVVTFGLAMFFVGPYMELTMTQFYRQLMAEAAAAELEAASAGTPAGAPDLVSPVAAVAPYPASDPVPEPRPKEEIEETEEIPPS
jgi:uncharacterized membrane protein